MTWLAVTGYLWQQISSVFHNSVLPSTSQNLLQNMTFHRMLNTGIQTVPRVEYKIPTISQRSITPSFFNCSRYSSFCSLCNAWKRCSVCLYPQLVVRKAKVLLCCLCLFVYSDVQHFHYQMSLRSVFRIKTMFGSSLPPVDCKRALFWLMVVVFVCIWWGPARIDYMSNMAGILWETGYDYPSRHLGHPGFWWGSCCSCF